MVPKRRYLSYLRERWWVVMIFVAVGVVGLIAFETLRPQTYTSYAQLYLTLGPQLGASFFGEIKDDYATQIELLKGARLRGAAMEKLGPAAASRLKKPIDVEVVRPMGTSILQLRASGTDPVLAQQFLQALIDQYLAFKKDTRLSTTEDLVGSLTEQLSKQGDELQTEQDKWAAFQRTNNVALLDEEAKSAGMFLATMDEQLANLQMQRDLLEKGLLPNSAMAPTNSSQTNLLTNPAFATNGSFAALSSTDEALKATRVQLILKNAELDHAVTNGPQYLVKPLKDEVSQLQQNLAALAAVDTSERKAELRETEQRIALITNAIPRWQATISDSNNRLSEGGRLKTNIERQQGYYDHLLALLQNVDLTKNVQNERITVLEPPSPGFPNQGNLALQIVLAVMLGVAASAAVVFVWHLFDDRFVSVRDVKDQFGEVVLGMVPQIKIPKKQPQKALVQELDSRRAYSESYRHLRSALLLSSLGETRPQTLLFTGVNPAEGKTTIAVNIARVLARSGLKVVLVNADIHGKVVHELVDVKGERGLLDHLRGEADIEAISHSTDVRGLTFVPIGTQADRGEGIFLSPRLNGLMSELKRGSDFVILDGPPILAADDAALLVPHANAVVLVVRPFFTRARLVRQALEMLYHRRAKQVGIVFNRARPDDLAGHYAANGVNGSAKSGLS